MNGDEPDDDGSLTSRKGSALVQARSRLAFMGVLLIGLLCVVGLRATYLTTLYKGAEPKRDAVLTSQTTSTNTADSYAMGRADIKDRNGVLLATMVDSISLYADPKDILTPKELAQKLNGILPEFSIPELTKKLSAKGRFVWIKRGLTPTEIDAINALGEPGLNFRREPKRFYPQAQLTAHVVGYVSGDGDAQTGIERGLDSRLKNQMNPLVLSLDVRIQHASRQHLIEQIKKFKAKAGMVVVMNAKNGEILAAVSYPDYDPNHPGDEKPDHLRNRFASDVNEMGSTFKLFTAAAQLELVKNSFNQSFNATSPLQRGRFKINDFHAQKRILTLPEVMSYSSNIGSALMGEKMGKKYIDFLTSFGLLDPLKTELYESTKPLLPKKWGNLEIMTATYGHGFAVGVLHLAKGVASLVMGHSVTPHFLSQQEPTDAEKTPLIAEPTSKKLRQLMRLVVTNGSGKNADVKGYMIGGKTGTSDKNTQGGYDENRRFATFVGTFPMNDPSYVIVASVDEPKGLKETGGYATAGYVAAPVVGNIVKDMAELLEIKPIAPEIDQAFYDAVKPYLKGDVSMSTANDH